MPRIKAENIAEHVAQQEAAVFDAAITLFIERGYEHVTLSDIAAQTGLARNSLYRYFPDKAHILLRWFEQQMPQQIERSTRILAQPGTPADRLHAWARDQIEYAARPEHELITKITALVPELDAAARANLAVAHEELMRPLLNVLGEAGVAEEDRSLAAQMIQALVMAVARTGGEWGARDIAATRALRRLDGSIDGLLRAGDAAPSW